MLLKLIVVVALIAGLGFLMRKGLENDFGRGLGKKNNEKWGMDDKE